MEGVKGLQNKLMQLRKICNHPFLFDEKAQYEVECFDVVLFFSLGHKVDELLVRAAGKFALLDHVLPKLKATGHRVLMFSQMTSLMDLLGYFFDLRF